MGAIDEFPATSAMGAPPSSEQSNHYGLSVGSLSIERGLRRITVPVYLSASNPFTNLTAGGMTLTYDPMVLKARGAALNLNGTFYGQVNVERRGEVRVAFLSDTPIAIASADHAVLRVEFDVLATDANTTKLKLSHAQLAFSSSVKMTDGILRFRPETLRLLQNFPNPFNPETFIPFHLNTQAQVTVEIYDVAGQIVRTLNLGRLSAGYYDSRHTAAYWDGRTHTGEKTASGMYFYRLRAQDSSAVRRMIILK